MARRMKASSGDGRHYDRLLVAVTMAMVFLSVSIHAEQSITTTTAATTTPASSSNETETIDYPTEAEVDDNQPIVLIAKPFKLPELVNGSEGPQESKGNKTNEKLSDDNNTQLVLQLANADIRESSHNVSVYLNRTNDFFDRNHIPTLALEQSPPAPAKAVTKDNTVVDDHQPSLASTTTNNNKAASQLVSTKFITFRKKFFSNFVQ